MNDSHSEKRIPSLDGLRGLAALSVATVHFQSFFSENNFMNGAGLAVDLFFILSGIVLAHVYEAGIRDGRVGFREYFVHRMARMYPLHIFTVVLALIIDIIFFIVPMLRASVPGGHLFIVPPTDWTGGAVISPMFSGLMNVLLLQSAGFGPFTGWNAPSWSISVEVIVNLAWFWLVFRGKNSTIILIMCAVLSAFLMINLLIDLGGLYLFQMAHLKKNALGLFNFGILRGVLGFSCGCLIYRHFIQTGLVQAFNKSVANLAGILAVAATAFIVHKGNSGPNLAGSDFVVIVVLFPILVLASIHRKTIMFRLLNSKPFVWLGAISYSVFLTHWIIGFPIYNLEKSLGFPVQRPLLGCCYLSLVLSLSWVSYVRVEKPLRKWVRERFSSTDSTRPNSLVQSQLEGMAPAEGYPMRNGGK